MRRFGEPRSAPQLTLGELEKSADIWTSEATKARMDYAYNPAAAAFDDDDDDEDKADTPSKPPARRALRPISSLHIDSNDGQMPSTSTAPDLRKALADLNATLNTAGQAAGIALSIVDPTQPPPTPMGPPSQSTPRKRPRDDSTSQEPPKKRAQTDGDDGDDGGDGGDGINNNPLDISRIETPDERNDFAKIAKLRPTEGGKLFDDQSFFRKTKTMTRTTSMGQLSSAVNQTLDARPSLDECLYRCNGSVIPHADPFKCSTCHRINYRSCDDTDTTNADRCYDCRIVGIKKSMPYRRNISAFLRYVRGDNRDPKVTISKYIRFEASLPPPEE